MQFLACLQDNIFSGDLISLFDGVKGLQLQDR